MYKAIFTFILSATSLVVTAQDVLFQGWYWNYPISINNGKWLPDINNKMPELQAAGFKYIWLPPLSRAANTNSIGYDIKDYFDLGDFPGTRWGNRAHLRSIKQTADNLNLQLVGDFVYNHREGGKLEDNPAVRAWVTSYNTSNNKAPYPTDRIRAYLPIGGNTGRGAGDYYIKVKSMSGSFTGKNYQFQAYTNTVGGNATVINEIEPNGGMGCGGSQTLALGATVKAKVGDLTYCNGIDEFYITITANQVNAAGDKLWFNCANTAPDTDWGSMSDHIVSEIWYVPTGGTGQAIAATDLTYQTYTDFTDVATNIRSGRGTMNYLSFRPNGSTDCRFDDEQSMPFFYDIDQARQQTRDTLFAYTRYMFQNAGMKGMRIDAVKHFSPAFIGDMLDNLNQNGIAPELVVGESFDYDPNTLKNWVNNVQASMDANTRQNITVKIFDFALREEMRKACHTPGYDVRNLFASGCADGAGMLGYNVVSFVNNHDFRSVTDEISNTPILPYAYILTNIRLGLPSVYYKDYYGVNNQRGKINALMKAHKRYIKGATDVKYLNKDTQTYTYTLTSGYPHTTLCYQVRGGTGASDVVVAINFAGDQRMKIKQHIEGATLHPGDTLTDIFAVSGTPFVIVDAQYQIEIEVPARNFGVWVKGDKRNELISLTDTLYISTENTAQNPTQSSNINTLNVFPNPFEHVFAFAINMEKNTNGIIMLQNTLGQVVFHNNLALQTGEQTYELQNMPTDLPKGVYFISLYANGRLYRQKVVKE